MTRRLLQKAKEEFLHTTDTLWQNEVNANLFVARVLIGTAVIDLIIMILGFFNVFMIERKTIVGVLVPALLELLIPAGLCFAYKGKKQWLKVFMLFAYTLVLARVESVLTHNVTLCMVFPVALSVRYYSRSVTSTVAFLTVLFSGFADYASVMWQMGKLNMNMVELPAGTVLNFTSFSLIRDVVLEQATIDYAHLWNHTLQHFYLPKLVLFSMVAIMCAEIAKRGRIAIYDQEKETQKTERISTELNLARDIQGNMLPNIFPPFPDRKEFDIFATMTPAKEVGGDFYDFYMIDDDHLALVIADVSGKGIPAAMLMMASKIIIKDFATLMKKGNPGEILESVNNQVTKNNPAEMFVTCWLGILELSTGKLRAANAGHEYPCVMHANGKFEMLKDKHGLVLGAMETSKYHSYEIQLEPGDVIFVYTDGVTEATNAQNELFGNDRLVDALNSSQSNDVATVLGSVQSAIDDFVKEAPQFDDLTMLVARYNGEKDMHEELTIEATIENIPTVTAFVDEKLEALNCPIKAQSQIDIAIDELFSNIAKFAYHPGVGPATVRVEVEEDPLAVLITFIDNGNPYDPLKNDDPDISLGADEREVGGLGVFLVKKTMDDISYEYKDGQNILKIKKLI
ncbi:MAG: SpoIIE family protein phosphatase [Solobacterium sp.]|nr:SpoIIE family protein phosphatase [Solobacterium sp.]